MTERIGRKAHVVVCRCKAPVLTGLDSHRCALVVYVDPYVLSALGEVEALRDRRRTYVMHRGELDRRDQFNIPGHPADTIAVLAEHRCPTAIPHHWRRPVAPKPRKPLPTNEIPF